MSVKCLQILLNRDCCMKLENGDYNKGMTLNKVINDVPVFIEAKVQRNYWLLIIAH